MRHQIYQGSQGINAWRPFFIDVLFFIASIQASFAGISDLVDLL
jgi:hypothetical protein